MEDELCKKADELWYYFERELFTNEGRFSYDTNLVFAFSDYVNSLSNEDLCEFLDIDSHEIADKFRLLLNNGIDVWLKYFSKTMALL